MAFVVRETKAAEPLVPLRLFKLRNVSVSQVVGVLWAAAMFAWFFLAALYLQQVLGYSALEVGLAFVPTSLVMMFCSLKLSDRLVMAFGIRAPLTVGLALAARRSALFAMAPVDGSFVTDVLPSMVLLGIGAGIAFNPVLLAAMGDVEPHEAGLASGVVNTSFMMGGALGLAVLVAVSDSRTASLAAGGPPRSRRCTAACRSPSRSVRSPPRWPRWSAGCSSGRSRWRCPSRAGRGRARLPLPGALRRLSRVRHVNRCRRRPTRLQPPPNRAIAGTAGRCPTVAPVTSLLIRRARLVPIGPTAAPPEHPVDVLVEDGLVTTVAAQLDARPGVEEDDADGRWCAPGLWDQHVHFTQWTLASQRLDLAPARSPEQALAMVAERVATLPGVPSSGGVTAGIWERDVTVSELDAVTGETPVVLIAGDGHHAWLNTTALMHLAMPVRDSVVRETEWFSVYPRLATLVGNDGTSPEAFRRSLDAAAARGIVGMVDFEFGGSREEWAERWAEGCDVLRVRWATYADTLDEVIDAGLRTGDPLPGCDERSRWVRSRSSATARSTPAPPGAASPTPTRTGWSTRPASPTSPATNSATCSSAPTAAASRSPPTRSGTPRSPRRWRRTPRPGPSARSSTRRWSAATTCAGWPSSASGPACSPRTCSTTAT